MTVEHDDDGMTNVGLINETYTSIYQSQILTRPKMPFRLTHRKEVTHSNGSYERKSRGRKLADEMGRGKEKSHYTLID